MLTVIYLSGNNNITVTSKSIFLVRDQFKRECNNITITRTTTQYREEVVEEEFISKKCDPDTKTVCHNLTIPKYEVFIKEKFDL